MGYPAGSRTPRTSFVAPIVASAVACLLEANPELTPLLIRDILRETAHSVPGADFERQGAGAVAPGQAVARALAERHGQAAQQSISPRVSPEGVTFVLHDHGASRVQVLGSWNHWSAAESFAKLVEPGIWETEPLQLPSGQYSYKFFLDGHRWLDDPGNPRKSHDGNGGLNSVFTISGDGAPSASRLQVAHDSRL